MRKCPERGIFKKGIFKIQQFSDLAAAQYSEICFVEWSVYTDIPKQIVNVQQICVNLHLNSLAERKTIICDNFRIDSSLFILSAVLGGRFDENSTLSSVPRAPDYQM